MTDENESTERVEVDVEQAQSGGDDAKPLGGEVEVDAGGTEVEQDLGGQDEGSTHVTVEREAPEAETK